MLLPRIIIGWVVPAAMIALDVGVAFGQDYPNKPIRIVTHAAGGGNDFVARLIAQEITGPLRQPVIVDNRGGAITAGEIVSKAAPDGYTLFVSGSSFIIGHLLQKTPYDSVADFSPITAVGSAPSVLVVHPSVAAGSVKDLIAIAKAKPGALNYASGSTGSPNHLGAELFKSMAGVNIVRVAYKATGPAVNDLVGGHVQLMFGNTGAVMPHVKTGRLKALAVTSAQPSALVPGLPTVAATGLPGYEIASADSVFAPAKTPDAIINRLNQEIVRAINKADVKERLFDTGTEVVGSSPKELADRMRAEIARMGKVIKEAGIKGD